MQGEQQGLSEQGWTEPGFWGLPASMSSSGRVGKALDQRGTGRSRERAAGWRLGQRGTERSRGAGRSESQLAHRAPQQPAERARASCRPATARWPPPAWDHSARRFSAAAVAAASVGTASPGGSRPQRRHAWAEKQLSDKKKKKNIFFCPPVAAYTGAATMTPSGMLCTAMAAAMMGLRALGLMGLIRLRAPDSWLGQAPTWVQAPRRPNAHHGGLWLCQDIPEGSVHSSAARGAAHAAAHGCSACV